MGGTASAVGFGVVRSEILAPQGNAALVRVHGASPAPLDPRLCCDDGRRLHTARLICPDALLAVDGRWCAAFALPVSVIVRRPRRMWLEDGGEQAEVPWTAPDLLVGHGLRPAPEPVATGIEGRISPLHLLGAAAGWVVFVGELGFQLTAALPDNWSGLLAAAAVQAALIATAITAWVVWNKLLHRRHGERRARGATEPVVVEHDTLGRPILYAVDDVAAARLVVVSVAEHASPAVKRYVEQRI
jgi:hypothetical protein